VFGENWRWFTVHDHRDFVSVWRSEVGPSGGKRTLAFGNSFAVYKIKKNWEDESQLAVGQYRFQWPDGRRREGKKEKEHLVTSDGQGNSPSIHYSS